MKKIDIDNLIRPIDRSIFLKQYWSNELLYLEKGAIECKNIFSWAVFNKFLTEHRLSYPRVRLINNDGLVNPDLYVTRKNTITNQPESTFLNLSAVNNHLSDGGSLIFNAVDEVYDPLKQLCKELSKTLECNVSANAYASFGNKAGFPLHWDDHEVMVIQIEGKKRWKVYSPTRLYPLKDDIQGNEIKPNNLIWEGILSPGDFLYVPRGFWHEVSPIGKPTLHLSLAAQPPTGYTWLEWILQKTLVSKDVRRNIPIFSTNEEIESYANSVSEYLIKILNRENISDYLQSRKGQLPSHSKFSFPYSIDMSNAKNMPIMRFSGINFYKVDDRDDSTLFIIGAFDKNWRFSRKVEKTIDLILSSEYFSFANLESVGEVSTGDLVNLVKDLLKHGFIEIVEDV